MGDAITQAIREAVRDVVREELAEIRKQLADVQVGHAGPRLIRLDQAAQLLGGCSVRQVQRLITAGDLEVVRLVDGGRPMVRLADVERLINDE